MTVFECIIERIRELVKVAEIIAESADITDTLKAEIVAKVGELIQETADELNDYLF